MHQIDIRALSVNHAWQGKRYKTPRYRAFEINVAMLLPPVEIPDGLLSVSYEFGIPKNMDWDNPIKPFQDILQAKYGFDDRRIMEAQVRKVVVKKGQEYIKFDIRELKNAESD